MLKLNSILKQIIRERVVDAYHGSPHKFNKFSLDHIGTGEGVQAFGWGLYFTDLEGIARHYAETLTDKNQIQKALDFFKQVQEEILPDDFSGDEVVALYAIERLRSIVRNEKFEEPIWLNKRKLSDTQLRQVEKIVDKYKNKLIPINLANLYKVSLHKGKTPDQYTWLEWDKPITTENINKIKKQFKEEKYRGRVSIEGDKIFYTIGNLKEEIIKGKDLYYALAGDWGQTNKIQKFNAKETSLFLLRAGIDGIKYPAESIARGATSDTAKGFNYVVFNENIVTIDNVQEF